MKNNTVQQSFGIVYEETYSRILKYVISKCDNLSSVEDIMQNIYVRFYTILENDNSYIENSNSFLIKLAKNELYKHYSLKNKFKTIFSISIDDYDAQSYLENIADERINVEDEIINNANNDSIWQEIGKEDLVTQKILTLHFLEDVKISEIATILDLSESTIKSKLYRSLERIRKSLGGKLA